MWVWDMTSRVKGEVEGKDKAEGWVGIRGVMVEWLGVG